MSPAMKPVPALTAGEVGYVITGLKEVSELRVGDTLTSIARAFGTTGRSIAWWNRGTYPSLDPESPGYDPNRLELGWVLVLIPGTTVDEADPPSPSPGPATPTPGAMWRPQSLGSSHWTNLMMMTADCTPPWQTAWAFGWICAN